MNGFTLTAAESVLSGRRLRSSCKKVRKFAASSSDFWLQPIPSSAGYSQLTMRGWYDARRKDEDHDVLEV